MPRVFLHTYDSPTATSKNEGCDFTRVPCVGEFLTTASNSEWYEVRLVVHCPFDATYAAEVYAVLTPQGQAWITNTYLRTSHVPTS